MSTEGRTEGRAAHSNTPSAFLPRGKKNPSYFYSYAKKFSRVKSKIGPLKDDQGYFVSDPKQMANMLQRQFCSVFSDPNAKSITEPSFPPAITSLEDIQVIL